MTIKNAWNEMMRNYEIEAQKANKNKDWAVLVESFEFDSYSFGNSFSKIWFYKGEHDKYGLWAAVRFRHNDFECQINTYVGVREGVNIKVKDLILFEIKWREAQKPLSWNFNPHKRTFVLNDIHTNSTIDPMVWYIAEKITIAEDSPRIYRECGMRILDKKGKNEVNHVLSKITIQKSR